jgi:hypothetical protein
MDIFLDLMSCGCCVDIQHCEVCSCGCCVDIQHYEVYSCGCCVDIQHYEVYKIVRHAARLDETDITLLV